MYMKIFKLVLKFLSFNIYPKRLLPVHGNEIIIRENINLDSFLCRRVEDQVNLKDSEGRLSPNAIDPEGEYFKLSTNIIPQTKTNDLKYRVLNPDFKFKYYVAGGYIPKYYEVDFHTLKGYGCFFFQIRKLHNFTDRIPFKAKSKQPSTTESTVFHYYIDHKPMVFNYHHYEASVSFGEDIKPLKPSNFNEGTYQAAILHKLRTKFRQISVFDIN